MFSFGVVFQNDRISLSDSNSFNVGSIEDCIELLDSKVKSMKKISQFFVDIALQSLEIQKYKYSVQAIAAVVVSRKILNIEPTWNPKLGEITKTKFEDIEE